VTAALTALLTVLQVAAMPAGPAPARHRLTPGSVWDSVYTLVQAGRGESTFRATCASCHGDSLAGINDAPPLTGPDFLKNWDGNTLGKLFNRISNDMPSDNPGSLSKPQVVDLVAFVLKYNAFPAGQVELPAVPESLVQIKFGPKP
jgi:mono/diheme cytochrome c family protein